MDKVALFGYSGHAYVVSEAISMMGYNIVGYFDQEEARTNPFNLTYLGNEQEGDNITKVIGSEIQAFVGIGDNSIRRKVSIYLSQKNLLNATIIHPKAIVSSLATIGDGSFVGAGAIINPLVNIGQGAIINTSSIIEHECCIGDFAHIAPGAVLAGNVKIDEGSFIGANAVIKQGVKIGKNTIVGAGAVVLKDVPDNVVWAGNPAIDLKK